jgi:hypothetical protein
MTEDQIAVRFTALRPTIATIVEMILDAGYDARNQFAARRVLAARNLTYWEEFVLPAKASDWLIWAAEDVSATTKTTMKDYYNDALN